MGINKKAALIAAMAALTATTLAGCGKPSTTVTADPWGSTVTTTPSPSATPSPSPSRTPTSAPVTATRPSALAGWDVLDEQDREWVCDEKKGADRTKEFNSWVEFEDEDIYPAGGFTDAEVGAAIDKKCSTLVAEAKASEEAEALRARRYIDTDGSYLVGDEIDGGTWTHSGKVEGCYWERATKSGDIVDNDFASVANHIVVHLRLGEFFTTKRCGDWKRS